MGPQPQLLAHSPCWPGPTASSRGASVSPVRATKNMKPLMAGQEAGPQWDSLLPASFLPTGVLAGKFLQEGTSLWL